MAKIRELRDKRNTLVEQMRALTNTAGAANRDLTAEEETSYDALFAQTEKLAKQIEREERLADLERDTAANRAADPAPAAVATIDPSVPEEYRNERWASPEYRVAYRRFLRTGIQSLTGPEVRALNATDDTAGGFLRAPIQMVSTLLKALDNMVFIRSRATKFQVPSAVSLGVPTMTADVDDADWTSELATGNEDDALRFGRRELSPHPLAKRIKISNKLLRSAVIDVEGLVRDRLAYKFGVTEEKAFLTGSGINQPLGVFTASADGISTARDVSTGNTTTGITFDGLIEAKYSIKGGYWSGLSWMFGRAGVKQIAKLKDGEGQYLWQPSKTEGEPDRALGFGVAMSEYVPSTFTTGLYVGILGNFSFYWIADALDMQIQRLVELYAETNQTGFIARKETDGMPVLDEAFARVKLA